ncbi:hypothetical protein AMELA_G00276090 [Ameiurus melas]|uniref:Butyrophilin subfamily 1 member A1-like n=1 Tax=Ameiurus melas TaxID=219545 RepID=A0A7J5ZLW6_AMEME|nr:hypothetical protein AMELA_G00276090 [Ameiurus melas]
MTLKLFLSLFSTLSEFSVVTPNASVSALLGSSVVLPCGLSPSLNARTFEVRWFKNGDINNLVLLYQDQKVQENVRTEYRDRVSLIGELDKGNVSLKLDNLKTVDRGEYTCFVKSISWYDKHSMNLLVKALGSTPLLSYYEAGENVNVTCTSGGWLPKPTLTWRNNEGRELPDSHAYYRTGSEGLMNVSSWLLISLSDLEWISCTVGLNHQEVRESRIVPHKGFWREAFITTLVLSLTVLITFTVLLILFRKVLLRNCSSHKDEKAAADSPESLPAEKVPLNAPENATENITENTTKNATVNTTANTTRGISSTEEPSLKDRYKVSLTLDPSTAHRSIRVTAGWKRVHCIQPNTDCESKFPHVVSKEELGSGQHYWEVLIWDRTSAAKRKSSWCVGVTQKPHSENVLRALCYEEETGLYPNTDEINKIPFKYNMTRLGLYLNCERNTLSFYNADKTSYSHLHTFNNIPHATYFALFSPGVKDVNNPLRIVN